MRDPLVLAVAQPPCVARDVAANALAHAEAVRSARARVVVFPELSLTGYELAAPAIEAADPRLEPLVTACAATGSLALVGAPLAGDHIAMLAVDGSGVTVAYRKMWLGSSESARFSPGDKPAVIEVDGWRFGLAICKDVAVPQHQSDTAALRIDGYLAGTVKFDYEAQEQSERAARLAAQHGMWVAIASHAGPTGDGYTATAARSGIWDPQGNSVAQAGPEIGALARATLT
ncbi:hydrolase [Rhizocola hellebori]|uniref:Hydrolase n=1 Tax=Rhizocola hellebori TaxID=1392758 RepID=A0A8J3Q980_9ACTN|nr:carbon-nitrogen hydrolase family protein [Rhizocola hellebori]GIH06389.1 hydrolase [Rhizocola hellebori]